MLNSRFHSTLGGKVHNGTNQLIGAYAVHRMPYGISLTEDAANYPARGGELPHSSVLLNPF